MTGIQTNGGPVDAPGRAKRMEPWHIVVCCVLGTAVGASTISSFGIGGFITEFARDLNWTRSGASNAVSLYLVGLGISGLLTGILIDRIGPLRTTVGSVLLLGGFFALMGVAQTPLMLLAACLLMGLAAGATTTLPYQVVISSRFHRRRGLALGLGTIGNGVGGMIFPLIIGFVTIQYDWRIAVFILAALLVIVALPAALIGLRLPKGAEHSVKSGASPFEPLKRRQFVLIMTAFAIATVSVAGVVVQGVPLMTDRGVDRATAAAVLSTVAISSIAGRIICGYLMDRIFAPYVAAAIFALATLGLLMVIIAPSGLIPWIGFVLMGFTLGAEADVSGYLCSRYLPRAQLGRAIGLVITAFSIANALGVSALGYSYDLFGSYQPMLFAGLVLVPIAIVMLLSLGPYLEKHDEEGA